MFEVGFQELALIFGVALVVLGPKRLSGLVNTIGRWVGKARVMARDFRQQLETEVNLEELNRITDLQSSPPRSNTMPPEFTGAPIADTTAPTGTSEFTAAGSSGPAVDPVQAPAGEEPSAAAYPYSAPDSPSSADDTYSHAHAQGEAPTPWSGETWQHAGPTEPAQASLDLEAPEDLSQLPPDDARRNA